MTTITEINAILTKIQHSIPDDYELAYFRLHRHRYQYILNKIASIQLPKHARILDVGCYPLHLFSSLQLLQYEVYGISSTHEPIKANRIKIVNIEKNPLPFPNGFFDLILFSEIMEHLTSNPLVYLSEFKRILKPNGQLIITTPNAAGLHKIVPILLGRSTYFPLSDLYQTKYDNDSIYYRHNREYTISELIDILSRAGYTIKNNAFFNAYRSYHHKEAQGNVTKQLVRIVTFWLTTMVAKVRDTLYIEAKPRKT